MTDPIAHSEALQQERLSRLRDEMLRRGIDAYLQPTSDAYLNEFVPPPGQRLAWLTGFTGSNGQAVVLESEAALFTDGRYTLQAAQQVSGNDYTIHNLSEMTAVRWIGTQLSEGRRVGIDPYLWPIRAAKKLNTELQRYGKQLVALDSNPIDTIWADRPSESFGRIDIHEMRYAGESSTSKRRQLCEQLAAQHIDALFVADPSSVCWLMNIRGHDVPHTPLVLAHALLEPSLEQEEGLLTLFIDERRLDADLYAHFGEHIRIKPPEALAETVKDMARHASCHLQLDPATTPYAYGILLESLELEVHHAVDPCLMPKACKNACEVAGSMAAHARDGLALTRFLHWLDEQAPHGTVSELSAAEQLQHLRREVPDYRDDSFDYISGFGANGAIVHYRATESTSVTLGPAGLYLIDSGAQYPDGTTDVTRTVTIGTPTEEQRHCFTRVLKGHIALATAIFPEGTTGTQLDILARQALWEAGLDYDHGTGHGVGSYLGVHEGPQRISKRAGDTALRPGMILSIEPGYYKAGEFGIRIENLAVISPVDAMQSDRPFYRFEMLTKAPIDRRLIDETMLNIKEKEWLNGYHAMVAEQFLPDIEDAALKGWLEKATRAL